MAQPDDESCGCGTVIADAPAAELGVAEVVVLGFRDSGWDGEYWPASLSRRILPRSLMQQWSREIAAQNPESVYLESQLHVAAQEAVPATRRWCPIHEEPAQRHTLAVMAPPRIGILAVQGDVREHAAALTALGADVMTVRRPNEVEAVDGLVIPGGESTVMDKLVRSFELQEPLRKRIANGMPAFGSCAGMIMLADRIADARPDQETLGGLDMTVRRNAFGRQVDSFEQDLDYAGLDTPFHAVFIRAPWVEEVGEGVSVLARTSNGAAAGRIVAVRQGNLMATSFHPEVGGDPRIHAEFVGIVEQSR